MRSALVDEEGALPVTIGTIVVVLMGRHSDHWEKAVKPQAFLQHRRHKDTRYRHDLLPQPASDEHEKVKMRPVNPLSPNHGPTALKHAIEIVKEAHNWVCERYPLPDHSKKVA